MLDFDVPWGGDLNWTSSGDIRTVGDVDMAVQRITRRVLSNPAVKDTAGNVVMTGDDPFNQDYGEGLGRDVEGPFQNWDNREARIRAALRREEIVDQTVPPDVSFIPDQKEQAVLVSIQFRTASGTTALTGLKLS